MLGGYYLLRSLAGCARQNLHWDYIDLATKTKLDQVMPCAVVIALENNTHIYVEHEKLHIPTGSDFKFRGDVVHAETTSDFIYTWM